MAKIALQIRIDESLRELIKGIAEEEMRSLNAQMEYFIKQGAERYLKVRGEFWDSIAPPDEPQQ